LKVSGAVAVSLEGSSKPLETDVEFVAAGVLLVCV